MTLDLSVPDIEIEQPNAFTGRRGGQQAPANPPKWRNPLSEALSHVNAKKIYNPAIQSDDDDDDDLPIAQPEIDQIGPPGLSFSNPKVRPSKRRKGKREKAPLIDPELLAMEENQSTESNQLSRVREDESEKEELELQPKKQKKTKIQVLGFHDDNPVFRFQGRTYIGQWTEVYGTDMVFAPHAEGDRFPILRNLKNDVDLVCATGARIQATEAELTPKTKVDMLFDARRAAEKRAKEKVAENPLFARTESNFPQDQTVQKKGRQPKIPQVGNEEEALREEKRRQEEAKHLRWLEKFQALKREMGETDIVPLVMLPAENDHKAMSRHMGRDHRPRKNLFRGEDNVQFDFGAYNAAAGSVSGHDNEQGDGKLSEEDMGGGSGTQERMDID